MVVKNNSDLVDRQSVNSQSAISAYIDTAQI